MLDLGGSKARRQLAKREGRQHQKIARCRKDFQYKTAHKLVRTGKKVFFHEDLNLKGLTRRNAPKQDEMGVFMTVRSVCQIWTQSFMGRCRVCSILSNPRAHSWKSWGCSDCEESCLYVSTTLVPG